MTEKEKMLSGVLYNPNDNALLIEREYCKDLCHKYNLLMPSAEDARQALLKDLFGNIAGTCTVLPSFWCDYGYNIKCGDNFYANHNCVILDAAEVSFGDNVLIGPNCGFYTAGHPLDTHKRNLGLEYAYPISIGNNVWVGGGSHFVPGVSVGDNTVIGAGSVVVKNIPAGVVAAGNPCKVLKRLN